jgi:HPt (histidine-containing phosphotransfer) domain-containing protein
MQSTAQEKDANKLARLAHNLKGACLNFGTEPLATLCKALEDMGKRDDLQFAQDLLQQMQEEIVRLRECAEEKL